MVNNRITMTSLIFFLVVASLFVRISDGLGKNLVVCCDGTWATKFSRTGQTQTPTNVRKLYLSLDVTNNTEQVAYYQSGIGTSGNRLSRWLAGSGATSAADLFKKMSDAYAWLGKHYEPGDRIFLFGFSRGAFTVRSLADMINCLGLLDLRNVEAMDHIDRARSALEQGYLERKFDKAEVENWAKTPNKRKWLFFPTNWSEWKMHQNVDITFLGVWDTVGQFGIPREFAFPHTRGKFKWQDVTLPTNIKHARHAVAMDEVRSTFQPTLWDEDEIEIRMFAPKDGKTCTTIDCKQVWFPGAHGNVGGGLKDTGLSDGALLWMIKEAEYVGLEFKDEMIDQIHPDFQDSILHSYTQKPYDRFAVYPRCVPAITKENVDRNRVRQVHESAFSRSQNPPISESPYFETHLLEPGESVTVTISPKERWDPTGVYVRNGDVYELQADGIWYNQDLRCDPEGKSGWRRPMRVLPNRLQSAFHLIASGEEVRIRWARRFENYPLMSLMCTVADCGYRDIGGERLAHTSFHVGTHGTLDYDRRKAHWKKHEFRNGGYLYCFANDCWGHYHLNEGRVTVNITRVA